MIICNKHKNFATMLDEHVNLNNLQIRFIREIVTIDQQELIEKNPKNHCMVCFLGHSGRASLKKIVREELDKRLN